MKAIAAMGALLVACSSGGGGGNDGGGDVIGTPYDAGGDAGGINCNPIPNVGMTVNATSMMGAPPTMTGGTLVEGTYVETGYVYYNGMSASGTHKETLVFANGTVKNINSDNGKPDVMLAGTYATSGNMLTMNIVCPMMGTVNFTYTATPTTLAFITSTSPNKVETWTKQ